jgi:L-seryl-tRNA(Ser) seleniumtransferase
MKDLEAVVLSKIHDAEAEAYSAVINATGVLLHTNLGRAPMTPALPKALQGYLALEYDIKRGKRGQRLAPMRDKIARACGAESAVMVNNNAASLLLILAALTRGKEVIVSRSQLIEIGGSFRLPAVMEAAGCRLIEVGCTNRTHLEDYKAAITENTAALLVAHQSNFRIVGFTTAPSTPELAALAHENNLPLVVDQGSGCLHDLRRWGLPHEETVGDLLNAGADIVCFSGDKLLGGPQAGIIVGSDSWVGPLATHPLYRALRPDKTALVLMDQVLRAHEADRLDEIPLYAMLNTPIESIKRRAGRIGRRLRAHGIPARGRKTRSTLGGGTTPDETLPGYGLEISGGQTLLDSLREQTPPIIGRIEDDRVVLDLRTVFPEQDGALIEGVLTASASADK